MKPRFLGIRCRSESLPMRVSATAASAAGAVSAAGVELLRRRGVGVADAEAEPAGRNRRLCYHAGPGIPVRAEWHFLGT